MEKWEKIDEPFERYSVSNLGRIRNDENGYILKTDGTKSSRYVRVVLKNSTSGRNIKAVHVLVAQ